jgi:hypothetical protein
MLVVQTAGKGTVLGQPDASIGGRYRLMTTVGGESVT